MAINTEEKRNHTAVRLGRGLPPHKVTRVCISPGIDPVETDAFRLLIVQDFESVAVEDGDDGAGEVCHSQSSCTQ
jgi:hypothetical protein